MEFPGPSVAPAGPSKDTLLPQLLTNGREKKQNVLHKRRAGKIPRPPNAFMIFANEWRRKLAFQHPCKSFRFVEECVLVLMYYCVFQIMHSFLKNVSRNSVVQLIYVEADICAVCFCNKFGNGELFVPVVVHSLLGMRLETADCKCCQFHCALFLTLAQHAV